MSLLIANIVLNDVDKVITSTSDDNRLFIRYCDDMILLHTDYNECCRLKDLYIQSLQEHGLYFHGFEHVTAPNADGEDPRKHFWNISPRTVSCFAGGLNAFSTGIITSGI